MITLLRDAEAKLLEMVNGLKGNPGGYYAIHFHFSQLMEQFRSEYQIKIAVNIINDLFKGHDGAVFICKDADIFVIYMGEDKPLLEKVIFQLRYLLMDDPLAYSSHGVENDDFCSFYDLAFQWRDFSIACNSKLRESAKVAAEVVLKNNDSKPSPATTLPFLPQHLVRIEAELEHLDLSRVLRQQSICAAVPGKSIKPVFDEIYISIAHLRHLIMPDVDLLSNRHLFRYLTELLDKKVLHLVKSKPYAFLQGPVSLNLNVATLLSEDFLNFDAAIKPNHRVAIVIEIDVADMFANMTDFITARIALQGLGYRLCLDGVDIATFLQVDRERLGFDMVKLRWNEMYETNNNPADNKGVEGAIQKWGANRIILCRCDSKEAISYGRSLGISLYQGRYVDKAIDPLAKVTN